MSDTLYNKDAAIAAQNAGSTAAVLLPVVLQFASDVETVDDVVELYNTLRTEVFNGTLALGGAEAFVEAVESSPQPQRGGGRSFPRRASGGGNGGASGNADPSETVINFGKNQGKTLGAIYAEGEDGESYINWLAENATNAFIARMAQELLVKVAA